MQRPQTFPAWYLTIERQQPSELLDYGVVSVNNNSFKNLFEFPYASGQNGASMAFFFSSQSRHNLNARKIDPWPLYQRKRIGQKKEGRTRLFVLLPRMSIDLGEKGFRFNQSHCRKEKTDRLPVCVSDTQIKKSPFEKKNGTICNQFRMFGGCNFFFLTPTTNSRTKWISIKSPTRPNSVRSCVFRPWENQVGGYQGLD